jgi:hypothetical protein
VGPVGDIEYKLTGDHDMVIVGGAIRMLGSVITEQRQKAPKAEAMYHKLVVNETDPSKFSLTQTHRVFFVPSPASADETTKDGNIGTRAADPAQWATDVSSVSWNVRWVAKGLQSQAPKVILTKDATLPPGHALILSP